MIPRDGCDHGGIPGGMPGGIPGGIPGAKGARGIPGGIPGAKGATSPGNGTSTNMLTQQLRKTDGEERIKHTHGPMARQYIDACPLLVALLSLFDACCSMSLFSVFHARCCLSVFDASCLWGALTGTAKT